MNNHVVDYVTFGLVLVNILVAGMIALRETPAQQFVLTPFYQVVPKGSVWTAEELAELKADMPTALEARDMGNAYARLGSTLSVDDVLKGIDALEKSDVPLDSAQLEMVQSKVQQLKTDHREMIQVQQELVRLENRLVGQTKAWGVLP